jgi:voltage-gated potassium channel
MSGRDLSIISRHIHAALADPVRRLQLSLLILLLLHVGGTLGFMLLQDNMSLVDAFYMTIITISTVGFGEVHPLTPQSRIFASGLIILGIGTATWAIGNAVEVVLGQTLWLSVQRRKMEELLMTLEHHYIVCGYGRLRRQIARDLHVRGERFVVVEISHEIEETLTEECIPHVVGDATQDEVLQQAGIERAKGLVAVLSNDAGYNS